LPDRRYYDKPGMSPGDGEGDTKVEKRMEDTTHYGTEQERTRQ
jgi:hypothetical protein